MGKRKLLIDKEAFCNWYFDHDICKEFFNRHKVLKSLEDKGEFKITLQHILNGVGYLPEEVVIKGQNPIIDDNGEVDMSAYDTIVFN